MVGKTSFTSAGNVTSLFMPSGKGMKEKFESNYWEALRTVLKMTSEIRCLFKVGEKQHIATAWWEESLCEKGSNQAVAPIASSSISEVPTGIRAFGSLHWSGHLPSQRRQPFGYIDETGDVKLEANIEYRFPGYWATYMAPPSLTQAMYGWWKESKRPGGELTMRNFAKAWQFGTGVGLRYDLTFLVIRLDLGIALHAPYDTGKSGYYKAPKFKTALAFTSLSATPSKWGRD